jgi:RHS repeat-associated protein
MNFIHADHLGRPIRMTDAAKVTTWQATWKPWGEVQTLSGTNSNNLRFPGQYFQIETGLHYNHHRMYDPVTGRYTQPDPLRFVDGPSIYAYAKNSPYMYTDREGLEPGKGERGYTGNAGGTSNPDKYWKDDPKKPGWGWQKTHKLVRKPTKNARLTLHLHQLLLNRKTQLKKYCQIAQLRFPIQIPFLI